MDNKHIEWIDSFKGIAMMGVFLVHCGSLAFPQINFIFRNGNRGVELFYLCTGFLACMKPPKSDSKHDIFNWLKRKYFRIMVLAVIAYIVSFLFNYIHNAGSGFTALRWIYKNNPNKTNLFSLIVSLSPVGYLFTQDINSNVSTWLLANTLFALFYNKISNKYKSVYICLASMILMFFIPEIVIKICQQYNLDQAKWLLYFEYKMRGIYSFSLGIMIYFIKPALDKLKNKYSLTSIANFGSLFATVALLYGFYKYTDWNTVYIMLFVTMIIVCQMLHENIAFVNKIWSRLGKYSYAFFYVHIPVVYYLCDILNHTLAVIIGFILSFILSIVITKYIEKPIVSFLNKNL